MKVFIACLGTETNTFSNLPTGWKTFEETMLFYGDATDNEPNTFSLPLHIWRKRSEERNYEVETEDEETLARQATKTTKVETEFNFDDMLQIAFPKP